jgi:flavorubredoxin
LLFYDALRDSYRRQEEEMDKAYKASEDVWVLPTHLSVPAVGVIPINAFLILAKEPVLVDAGIRVDSEEFLAVLKSLIDPEELRWVWLTHDDLDHTGSIEQVLSLAPEARLATHALSALRMTTAWNVPMDRVYALRPGDMIDVGDRKLTALRPPLFDNPMSTGIYDDRNRFFFSVDSFGAVLSRAHVEDAADLTHEELQSGMTLWETVDSPWAHMLEMAKYDSALQAVRSVNPAVILSSHLPPARGVTEAFLKVLASVPDADPFVAPNQIAFKEMLAPARP